MSVVVISTPQVRILTYPTVLHAASVAPTAAFVSTIRGRSIYKREDGLNCRPVVDFFHDQEMDMLPLS